MAKTVVQKNRTNFSTESVEILFGISLSRMAGFYKISRNMMSMIHRKKRSLPSSAFTYIEEFGRVKQLATNELILNRTKLLEKEFHEKKQENLKVLVAKWDFELLALQRKLNRLTKLFNDHCAQIARLELIDPNKMEDKIQGSDFSKKIELFIHEKKEILKKCNPSILAELQIKKAGLEMMIANATAEMEKLK